MCTVILPQQINYKQKNDKASDTTHSKIRIETQKSKLFNLKTKRMLKIAIMLTCYEKQKKINQKINDEVSNITHISNQNQNAKVKKCLRNVSKHQRGESEAVNLRWTYNTVAKRKMTNHDLQNTIKLKIEKYKHHKKVEVNSGVPKK